MKVNNLQTYLDYLYKLDYLERPVSFETFMCDERYLGLATKKGTVVYDIWKRKLSEFLGDDSKFLGAFTGSVGCGKTRGAVWGSLYVMYRLLLLKDPWGYFSLAPLGKMAVVFFNLTRSLGESKGYQLLQQHLLSSPWFTSRGEIKGRGSDQWLDIPLFEYVLASPGSRGFNTQGKDVILAVMDEVDSPDASEKMKLKVLAAYRTTVIRFRSRFVKDGETIAKFFLVASKQDQLSFMNTFVEEMSSSGSLYVVDIPIWEAKPKSDYCGKKFFVMIGDVYTNPKVLETEEEIKRALIDGYEIIEVPIEYKKSFEDDIVNSLKDLAGRNAGGARKNKLFTSEKLLKECYDPTKLEPLTKITIELGLRDKDDLIRFIDFSKIRTARNVPRFIHHDISYSGDGDASGLAMSAITGYKKVNTMLPDGRFEETPLPVVETDFAMRIKGKPGDDIPLFSIRKLVLDLRLLGFNIYQYSADLSLLSEETRQLLTLQGVNCKYISLDKDRSRYKSFRDIVVDGRWVYHHNDYVHFELKNLLKDEKTGKVDHPDKVPELVTLKDGSVKTIVLVGGKDLSDAIAGSVSEAVSSQVQVPNVEVIRRAIGILQQVREESNLVDSLLNIQKITSKKDEIKSAGVKQSAKFIDILKKANS